MHTIVVPLPDNLVTIIEPYRQKYDPLAKVIPPHITLVDPFRYDAPLDSLLEHLNEVGELHSPIKVFLIGWDTYEGEDYQLHLPMTAGRSELLALHYDLLAGPLNYLAGKMHGFWPRVVVGRFADPAEFESAKKELAGFTLNLVVRVKQMELLYRKEVGQSWQSVKLFGLKATMAGRARHKK
jgi:2'-5' RNA ligase